MSAGTTTENRVVAPDERPMSTSRDVGVVTGQFNFLISYYVKTYDHLIPFSLIICLLVIVITIIIINNIIIIIIECDVAQR